MHADTEKSQLRPLRLVRFDRDQAYASRIRAEDATMRDKQRGEEAKAVKEPEGPTETPGVVPGEIHSKFSSMTETEFPRGEKGARYLLKRTPTNYLLNQAYGLWVFASLFILSLIMTRKVSVTQYGVYAIAMAAFNTIAYIVAFGLEDATTTFVPRVLTMHGRAAAASLVRRMLALRLAILTVSVLILLFALPAL